jgi:hypothetical protein
MRINGLAPRVTEKEARALKLWLGPRDARKQRRSTSVTPAKSTGTLSPHPGAIPKEAREVKKLAAEGKGLTRSDTTNEKKADTIKVRSLSN